MFYKKLNKLLFYKNFLIYKIFKLKYFYLFIFFHLNKKFLVKTFIKNLIFLKKYLKNF
jgi:hypothetical protein